MKKTIILGTILLTSMLLVCGMYFPDFPLMWLATASLGYEILRAGLIIILGILLFSNPPRALHFRYAIAGIASLLFVATIVLTMTGQINIVDAVVFVETAIIFGIEAVESPIEYANTLSAKQPNALAK